MLWNERKGSGPFQRTMAAAAVLLCFGTLAGCSSSASRAGQADPDELAQLSAEVESLASRVQELADETEELRQKLAEYTGETPDQASAESTQQAGTGSGVTATPAITPGEPVTVSNFAELTLKRVEFAKRVNPPNPGDFYSYYQVKDDNNIYLDTVIEIKSLLTTGRDADEFASVKVVYDGRYEYSTFSPVEASGGDDFDIFHRLEPLKTATVHFLAEVPGDVATSERPLKVVVSSNGQKFTYTVR